MTRLLGLALAGVLIALTLSGCGPDEAGQRQAFIAFLETDVLSAKGVRLRRPTAEQNRSFGDYAGHYAVITRFNDTMDRSVAQPLKAALSKAMPTSIGEVISRKADLLTVRDGVAAVRQALSGALATADKEKAALKQPEDLAAVYGKAYDKLVAQPAKTFMDIFPTEDEAIGAMIAVADLVDGSKGAIRVNGSMLEARDATLRAKLQAALDAVRSKQGAMIEAQNRFRRLVSGE